MALWTAEDFVRETGVSRETLSDYAHWQRRLSQWNARINLVAPKSLPDFWARHAYDSWQILSHLPDFTHCVDFGSGAGFPGLSIAIHAKHAEQGNAPQQKVTMVESVGKKTSFLRTLIRELDLPATARSDRIENLDPLEAGIITARAFAPLPRLLDYAAPHLTPGGQIILLKGVQVEAELEAAAQSYHFNHRLHASETPTRNGGSDESHGYILCLSNVKLRT